VQVEPSDDWGEYLQLLLPRLQPELSGTDGQLSSRGRHGALVRVLQTLYD